MCTLQVRDSSCREYFGAGQESSPQAALLIRLKLEGVNRCKSSGTPSLIISREEKVTINSAGVALNFLHLLYLESQ